MALTFSIVIPNYNQSRFIATACNSLQCQRHPFYLAVMDGGSTDGFSDVIRPYQDMISHLRSFPDNGQAAAIKEGFEAIPGDILGWLNADDYYFPAIFPQVAEIFRLHPEIDVVYGNAVHVTPDGQFHSYFPAIQAHHSLSLTKNCYICQPACFMRRSAYNRIGGLDSQLTYTMDWDLWCRLSVNGAKFYYLPELLAAVRYYPGTKTLSGDRNRYREIIRIERRYGKRVIPYVWIKFFHYELAWKQQYSLWERIAFFLLDGMRRIKAKCCRAQASYATNRSRLYGFDRWDNRVNGSCEINLPWYHRDPVQKISFQVEPKQLRLRIEISNLANITQDADHGDISLDLPQALKNPIRIKLHGVSEPIWKLIKCSFH